MTMLTEQQKSDLAASLNAKHVKTRTLAGRPRSYIEGWHAIAEANRIFGFDGWTRETVDVQRVSEHQRKVGQGDGWGVTYIARVRIRVGEIVREGCGTGHGIDRDLGQAHESAIKEAETDAMKRALMTFGNPFGLALYDKEQAGVVHVAPTPHTSTREDQSEMDREVQDGANDWAKRQANIIAMANRLPDLLMWLDEHGGDWAKPQSGSTLDRLKRKAPDAFKYLKQCYQSAQDAISKKEIA